MGSIFISHSSSNNERAVELQRWLATNGWDDVFLDVDPQRGIVAGQSWIEALQKAAHRCEVVLALISPEWLASGWCKAEIDAARLLGKKIIVALIGADKGAVPLDLRQEQWVDLDGDPNAMTRLNEGLKRAGLDPLSFPFEPGRRPYPGFACLEEEDAAIFFGRDAQIVRGLDKMRGLVRAGVDRMLVILGASGSGKSSFLRAGLWPRLKRDDRNWLPLPIIRPERAVMSGTFGLAQALQKAMGAPAFADEIRRRDLPRSRAAIQEFLETKEDGLVRIFTALREIARSALPGEVVSPPTIVVAVDQSEELFNDEGRDEARNFIEIFTRTLSADPGALAVMATRSDTFPQLQTESRLAQLSKDTFTLDMMLEGSYRAVIEGPAQLVRPNRLKIDPELTDALLEDLSGQDALPLLAFTLAYLYERYAADNQLNLAGYEKLGRLKGVIDATVREAFAEGAAKGELPKDATAQLALARAAFIPHLARVNPAGQFVRRVATRDEIPAEARPLVDRFAERRLLTKDRRSVAGKDVEVIEVAHEALLREWRELNEALLSEREFLVAKVQLEQDVADWRSAPEARKEGALLSGNKLLRARDWLAARPQDLFSDERLFIEASVAAFRRNEDEREAARQAELKNQHELAEAAVKLANERSRRAMIAIVGAVLSLGLAAFGGYEAYTANQNKERAEKQARIALSRQLASQAGYQATSDQLDLGLLLSAEALKAADTSEARSSLFTSLQTKPQLLQYLRARGSSIESMAADASGKHVLVATRDGSLMLWDFQAQSIVWRAENGGASSAAAFDGTGHTAVLATSTGRISVWSLSPQPKRMREFGVPDAGTVSVVALSPDGRIVAAGTNGGVALWDSQSGELLDGGLVGEPGELYALTFDPQGKTLAAAYNKKVVLWDVGSRKPIEPALDGHPLSVNSLAYSPDGKLLASASSNEIFLWDAVTHQQLGDSVADGANSLVVRALQFVDNAKLISAGDGGAVTHWSVFDQRLGKEPASETIAAESIHQIVALPSGTAIVLRSGGRGVLWNSPSGRSLGRPLEGYARDAAVSSMALDAAGRTLAIGGEGASILWDVDRKQIGATLVHAEDRADSIAFGSDGRVVAVGTCAAPETSAVERHRGKNCSKGKILVWTTAPGGAGAPLTMTGHESQVVTLAFNPDGTTLVSASWDNSVMLWSVKDGRPLGSPVKVDGVMDLAFTSDGEALLVRGAGGIVWRGKLTSNGLEGGTLVRQDDPERGYPLGLVPLASSADGTIWALDQSKTNSVVLWDKSTGRALGPELTGHEHTVITAAFSGDARLLATADGQQIMLWDLNPNAWAEQACVVADRNLRWDEWLQAFPDRPYRKTCDRLPVPYSVVKGTLDDTRGRLAGRQSNPAIAMAWAEEIGSPDVFNALCWEESLAGRAKIAAPFCERAVALAPSRADFRDSRGLCRALSGNLRGAIDDFTFYAEWKKQNSAGDWSESWKTREDWVARLQKGENPFDDPKTLAEQKSAAFEPAE